MFRYYYINRGWIVSRAARRVYRVAASLSLALFFVLLEVRLTEAIPGALVPVLKTIILAGVLGCATTMVAMEYFLFGFDDSSAMKKVFWFCVMLLPPLGPALYCFLVYSRSKLVNAQAEEPCNGYQPKITQS
jgi:hypothetical protein